MERMQIFSDEQFGKIRTITIEGEPWFVGKDVCAAFGDTNYRRTLGRLDADEKGVSQNDAQVEERMEMVRRFRRWITHEVIPSVRRNGIYMTDAVMEEVKGKPELIYEIAERIVMVLLRRVLMVRDFSEQSLC